MSNQSRRELQNQAPPAHTLKPKSPLIRTTPTSGVNTKDPGSASVTLKHTLYTHLRFMPPRRTAILREHRSVANMVQWLVRKHCAKAGISIREQAALSLEEPGGGKGLKMLVEADAFSRTIDAAAKWLRAVGIAESVRDVLQWQPNQRALPLSG